MFSQDSDFKERMFARQIAVMKGQAWNVVETLKTIDHGPLELTRRTRVCVWDDLVDIPVAIPMHRPSAEMRRRREQDSERAAEQEEMDISAANASDAAQPDLMHFDSPTDLPNPNRFNLSRNNSSSDLGFMPDGPETPATINGPMFDQDNDLDDAPTLHANNTRPGNLRSKTRISIESPSTRNHPPTGARPRRSFSARYTGGASLGDVDELEGDLGYSAAEGMENSRRKVIVERLETVKSKNPVFTWC